MTKLSPEEEKEQISYRDARRLGTYDHIWQNVGKCVFCDLREKYVFYEENGIVMTISLFAYIDGQFMIIPRRHVRSVKELTDTEWQTVRKFMYIAKKLIREVHSVKGMQFLLRDGGVEAQSTVDQHFHLQCIPFDAPDLSVWNYRQLKHTPLENTALYKSARKKIIHHGRKFNDKYKRASDLPIHCDAIILNDAREMLFIERALASKLEPDYLTQPGGRIEHSDLSLEDGLIREIYEETDAKLKSDQLQLVNSRFDEVNYKSGPTAKILRNTYLVKNFPVNAALKAGDDAKSLHWIPTQEVMGRSDISPETREIVRKVLAQNAT